MIRLFSVVLGSLVMASFVSGCEGQFSATLKSKTRFVEENVVHEDAADWGGGPIEIRIEGVGASYNGGVKVTADPAATKVRATARMLAMAVAEEKENADLSISEAKASFTIANDGSGVKVSCDHGGSHGSSAAGESGCELVEIVVPAGTDERPVELKVLSGNGTMTLRLAQAAVSSVGTNAKGDIDAELPATKGASISLVADSGDDITAKLPADFAADEVILQADADKIALGSFSEAKTGEGAGGYGPAGTGLKLLKLTSKSFAGSTGKITLK